MMALGRNKGKRKSQARWAGNEQGRKQTGISTKRQQGKEMRPVPC